jgi:hypothetical protein
VEKQLLEIELKKNVLIQNRLYLKSNLTLKAKLRKKIKFNVAKQLIIPEIWCLYRPILSS